MTGARTVAIVLPAVTAGLADERLPAGRGGAAASDTGDVDAQDAR